MSTTTDYLTNRYAGTCCGCGSHVYAREGFYHYGNVWCEIPTMEWSASLCSKGHEIAAREREESRKRQHQMNAERANRVSSPEEIARQAKHAEQDAAWQARGLVRCKRCGGAGGSSHWPGFTCYECGGHGATPADF